MASIYKRPDSKTWQAAFYVNDPKSGLSKQIRQSTGKTNEREARAIAADLERRGRDAAGAGSEKGRRILEVIQRAGQEAAKETLNAARAQVLLSEIVCIATGEDIAKYTIKSWFEEWLLRKSGLTAAATKLRYKASKKAFLTWLDTKSDKRLESLTVQDIRAFRQHLLDGGRTARTAQHYVRDIASCLRSAIREGLLTYNPASGLDALENEDSTERKPFVTAEILRLVDHAPSEDWRGAILCGAYAGLRLGDAAKLTWGAVDLVEGTLRLIPSKTKRKKREVCIPLHVELRLFLESHPIADDPDAPLFPSLTKRSVSGNKGLSSGFVSIMDAAKVSRGKVRIVGKESAGRTTHERGFHSLRHTFVTMLTNSDVGEDVRMKLAGHSTSESHAIYSHHEVKTLSAAIDKMPGLERRGDE